MDGEDQQLDIDRFAQGIDVFLLFRQLLYAMAAEGAVKYVSSEFERMKELLTSEIRTNPANNALHTLLSGAVNSALIQARECIVHLEIPQEIHGWTAIDAHRVIVAHPYRRSFNKSHVEAFYKDEQHKLDSKLVRIWGAYESIRTWAQKSGVDLKYCSPPRLICYVDIVDAAWSMLRHSFIRSEEVPRSEVQERLEQHFALWEKQIQEIYSQELDTGILNGIRRLARKQKKI